MNKFAKKNQINKFVNAQRVLQVILQEQLLVDEFTGKQSKQAIVYQQTIDFLKGRELEIRKKKNYPVNKKKMGSTT